jgi:hypothetical protein
MFFLKSNAQLGFCGGNSGDPIFIEDFGTAPSSAPQHIPLPAPGITTYNFLGSPPGFFGDGAYTVSNMNYQQWNWFNEADHTVGDTNGRMLVVNASFKRGEFYRTPISGLCANTTYEFSAWVKNLTPRNIRYSSEGPKPCNVSFEIWDSTNTKLLKSGNTGDFLGSTNTERGKWLEFALVFQTEVGQNSVILKMVNNGKGGYGNDLAIDDIVFKTCGDTVVIADALGNNNISINENKLPYSATLTATPDFTVFSTHAYQWQKSPNGINWTNIDKQNKNSFSVTGINNVTYYRVLVAEDAINLFNSSCNSSSEVYKISIIKSKEPPKPIKKVVAAIPKKTPETITNIKTIGIEKPEPLKELKVADAKEPVKLLEVKPISSKKLTKTHKKVIIVKDGLKIITNKVWVAGSPGKFVQTAEEIIKQGDINGGFIIEETIYTKARYGYNSRTRTYSTQPK